MPEKNKTKPNVRGKKIFHPININWSKRNLGKFARTKIKRKLIKIILIIKKKSCQIIFNKFLLNK
jgi:hypothetical protein